MFDPNRKATEKHGNFDVNHGDLRLPHFRKTPWPGAPPGVWQRTSAGATCDEISGVTGQVGLGMR